MSSIACRHILIKTNKSRRPASWRDPSGSRILNTSEDTAISQMNALRADIVAGKISFEDVAAQLSDCGSAQRNGDLGQFSRGDMQASFENAAFALQVGEISPIVVSDSGVHIIYRYA